VISKLSVPIGSQLSVLAEALGMRVLFYDLEDRLALGNAEACGSHRLPSASSPAATRSGTASAARTASRPASAPARAR